jgi:hypothetical protein
VRLDDHVAKLFAEYERERSSLGELQERMRALRASATSPRREVTVTVGQSGVLTDLRFPTGAYKRMPPAELRAVILRTFLEAKDSVQAKAAEILAPIVPEGIDPAKLARGDADVDMFLPEEGPRMTSEVRSMLGLTPEQPGHE